MCCGEQYMYSKEKEEQGGFHKSEKLECTTLTHKRRRHVSCHSSDLWDSGGEEPSH